MRYQIYEFTTFEFIQLKLNITQFFKADSSLFWGNYSLLLGTRTEQGLNSKVGGAFIMYDTYIISLT